MTNRPHLRKPAAILLAMAVATLAACGPAAQPAANGAAPKVAALVDPKAIVEAAADPCVAAKGLFLTSLCGHPELKDLTAQVKSTLVAEGEAVDRGAAETLRDGQQGWIAATRNYCGVDDAAGVLTADQVGCVRAALQLRVKEAARIIDTQGGITFQRVEMNEATKPVVGAAASANPLADLPVTKDVDYPRINAGTPQAEQFNALMRAAVTQLRPPPGEDASQTTEAIDYEIAFAGPDLVSVVFTANQSTPGAMHSDNITRVVNVVLSQGRELTPADVFAAPEARWQSTLVTRATQGIRRQSRDLRGVEISPADLRDTVSKPHNWRITERGLVLVLSPLALGGPPMLGVINVDVPWKDLKPLLKADAPAPIGTGTAAKPG